MNEFGLECVIDGNRFGYAEIYETLHRAFEAVLPLLRAHRSYPACDLAEAGLRGLDLDRDQIRSASSNEPPGDSLDEVVNACEERA